MIKNCCRYAGPWLGPWIAAALLCLAITGPALGFGVEPWILVDGGAAELRVMRGRDTIEILPNISVGRGGVGYKARQGDEVTPTGSFRVAWVNRDSPYHLFFGFDYPTRLYAERARHRKVLSDAEYRRIVDALERGEIPPQDTSLGGRLGIHGLGTGNAKIHAAFNWTSGCIALTNEQVDRLAKWVRIGTLVVVTH